MGQQKNTSLKAYVRFDGTGRIVPSSLILQRFKPKDGNWQEINATECCGYVPSPSTTTTTTTVAPTTTTTSTSTSTTTTTTTEAPTTTTTTTTAPAALGNFIVDVYSSNSCGSPIATNQAAQMVTTPVIVGKWYTDPSGPGFELYIVSAGGAGSTTVSTLTNERNTCN